MSQPTAHRRARKRPWPTPPHTDTAQPDSQATETTSGVSSFLAPGTQTKLNSAKDFIGNLQRQQEFRKKLRERLGPDRDDKPSLRFKYKRTNDGFMSMSDSG